MMTRPSMTAEIQALMAHADWVRALAHRLVRDPDLAEDLSQDTLVAALGGARAGPIRSTRAWLGGVMRNLLRERFRSELRRTRREAAVARDDTAPSSEEVVERIDAHRTLVDVIRELPENYQVVVLRRYYQGETPTEIAAQLGIPVATVKTRLQRGLAQLRTRLDAAFGGDGVGWRAALAPLLAVRPPATLRPPTPVRTAASLGAAAAAIAVISWAVAGLAVDRAARPIRLAPAGAGAIAAEQPNAARTPPRRVTTAGHGTTSAIWDAWTDAEPRLAARPLTGTAFSADGRAAAGVLLRFDSAWGDDPSPGAGTPIAVSDGDGHFVLRAYGPGTVLAAGTELATVMLGVVADGRVRDGVEVVVAPRRALHGTVLDPTGAPLAGAELEVLPPEDLGAQLPADLRLATWARSVTRSDTVGRFTFDALPRLSNARLRVRCDGHITRTLELLDADRQEVVLEPHPLGPHTVAGVVLLPDGAPATGVRVSCGARAVRTGIDGSFRIDTSARTDGGAPARRLWAFADGRLAGHADAETNTGDPRWPAEVVIRLGAAPRTIRGVVRDADGRPVARARVWIADPTVVAIRDEELGDGEWRVGPGRALRAPVCVEVLEGFEGPDADGTPPVARTGADGRFELRGLAERSYQLVAMDPSTLQQSPRVTVEAGSDLAELVLDKAGLLPKLTGHVLDRSGRPVAGASVYLQVTTQVLELAGERIHQHGRLRTGMVTDDDGVFWLRDVPAGEVWLRIEGSGIVPRLVPLPWNAIAAHDDLTVDVTIDRRLSLRVVSRDADEVGVVDSEGAAVWVEVLRGPARLRSERVRIDSGRSEVFEVSDHAVAVIAYRDGRELRRAPLSGRPGRVLQIDL